MAIVVAAGINSAGAVVGAQQFNAALATMRAGVQSNIEANKRLESSMGFLKTAAIAGVVAIVTSKFVEGAKAIVSYSDTFSQLKARLEIVTSAGTSVEAVMGAVSAAAERSRTPFSSLADIYKRNAGAMKDMGRSESEGIRLAENLAKVVSISGVSSSEAAASMMQLSQAIASGRFQGDEFRSVAENMPEVMRILQRETGKTAGQLKALGTEGAISAKVLVNALLNASSDIDAKFQKMPQTAGSAWDKLVDDFKIAVGRMAAESGVSQAWADVFNKTRELFQGDGFQSIVKGLSDALIGVAKGYLQIMDAAKEALTWVKAFAEAASNTTVYRTFAGALADINDAWAWAKSRGGEAWDYIREKIGAAGLALREAFPEAASELDATIDKTKELAAQFKAIAEWKTTVTKDTGNPIPEFKGGAKLPVAFEENSVQKAVAVERMRNELLQAEMAGEKEIELALKNQIDFRTKITKEMRDADPEAAKQLEYAIAQNNALRVQADRLREVQQLGERFASTISDGFLEAGKQGQSFIDALKGVSMKLVELIIKATILDPLIKSIGKGFGEMMPGFDGSKMFGGMLSGESVAPAVTEGWGALTSSFAMADGGVLDRPMKLMGAGAMGDVGEAGPEGVLPLRRDASGRLGVIASGSGGGNVQNITINVQGDATDATVERMRQVARNEFAAASPGLVKSSVNAVRREHSANPNYLRR